MFDRESDELRFLVDEWRRGILPEGTVLSAQISGQSPDFEAGVLTIETETIARDVTRYRLRQCEYVTIKTAQLELEGSKHVLGGEGELSYTRRGRCRR